MEQPDFQKDPVEVVDLRRDWTADLAELGQTDTVATSDWTADPGLVIVQGERAPSITTDGKATTVWVSGGTAHRTYGLRNVVVTAGGRTLVDTLWVHVTPR